MEKIIVDSKEHKVILNFKTLFYHLDAILESAQSYSDSCWTYVDGNADDAVIVTLSPKDDSINLKILGYEFYNYVLSVIQNP